MHKFVTSIQSLALAWGAPGIMFVAFLDSSVLSLPEIADLLVIYMVTTHPARFALYVTSATVGCWPFTALSFRVSAASSGLGRDYSDEKCGGSA